MSRFESVPVPFIQRGNRRGLSRHQIEEDAFLADFVNRFRSSFEFDPYANFFIFIEQNMPPPVDKSDKS